MRTRTPRRGRARAPRPARSAPRHACRGSRGGHPRRGSAQLTAARDLVEDRGPRRRTVPSWRPRICRSRSRSLGGAWRSRRAPRPTGSSGTGLSSCGGVLAPRVSRSATARRPAPASSPAAGARRPPPACARRSPSPACGTPRTPTRSRPRLSRRAFSSVAASSRCSTSSRAYRPARRSAAACPSA